MSNARQSVVSTSGWCSPATLAPQDVRDGLKHLPNTPVFQWFIEQARQRCNLVLLVRWHTLPSGASCLLANDLRSGRYWVPLDPSDSSTRSVRSAHQPVTPKWLTVVASALRQLQQHIGKPVLILPHGKLGFSSITSMPLSALRGDNITTRPAHTPWYKGRTLMGHLDTVQPTRTTRNLPRMLLLRDISCHARLYSGFPMAPILLDY